MKRRAHSFGGQDPYYRTLLSHLRDLNGIGFVFSPKDIDWENQRIRGCYPGEKDGVWHFAWFPYPDAVYNRYFGSPSGVRSRDIMQRFAETDVRCFNTSIGNKWVVYRQLSNHADIKPHLPATELLTGEGNLTNLLRRYRTVYVKPVKGCRGQGILRVKKQNNGYLLQQAGRGAPRSLGNPAAVYRAVGFSKDTPYILQQGIIYPEGSRLFDVRCLVQRNRESTWQITGLAARVGAKGGITANLHTGGYAAELGSVLQSRAFSASRVEEIISTLRRLALSIARILGSRTRALGELGLDFIVDHQGKVWFIEANPKPGRRSFSRLKNKEIRKNAARRPMEYALYLAGF